MTPVDFAAYVRDQTSSDSVTYTDADLLRDMNIMKNKLALRALAVNEDLFGVVETRNLVAGQRNYGLPVDQLNQIKYVEAQINGTDWQVLKETDLGQYGGPTDENSIEEYFVGKYCFDIFGGQLWILTQEPIIDVTNGLKLWSFAYPDDLTALTGTTDLSIPASLTSTAMPRALHEVWARSVIVLKKTSGDKAIPLTQSEQMIEQDIRLALESLRGGNLDRNFMASVPSDNGSEY